MTDLVALQPIARDQAPVLRNLLELYVHDFSEQVPLALNEHGRFDLALAEDPEPRSGVGERSEPLGVTPAERPRVIDRWWSSEDHFPFFIRRDGTLVGFALVARGSRRTGARDVMDIAEFFVVRGVRGQQVGHRAAQALFAAFPGRWEIRVRRSNAAALAFWSRTAERWLGRRVASTPFTVDGVDWDLLRLDPV